MTNVKKILNLFVIICLSSANGKAQYYYKDIAGPKEAVNERATLKAQQIRSIKVHSFEGNGEESPGFFCEKKISKDYRRIETFTKSNMTGKALQTSFYNDQDQLVTSADSSELSVATSSYMYGSNGRLAKVVSVSHSSDDDFTTRLTEEHLYTYNQQGQPLSMLRIKNVKDSTLVNFTLDKNGNVIDENDLGKNGRHYYYYYNDKNQLTDIVKFNVVKNMLMPDFMFEYNTAGQVIQMVAVEEGVSSDYYTWKYVYNDGLRIIEKCFSKERILLGYFEYEYD